MSELSPWLERELARQLGPVRAPEELWDRIHEPRNPRPASSLRWAKWPVAAVLLLMASGGVVWQMGMARDPAADMEKLAQRELLNSAQDVDFRSGDPAEIRAWVKAKADIDIDMPGGRSSAVRLLGARLIRSQSAPIASISYRVDGDAATLLVSRKHGGNAPSKHVFSSARSARLFSWSMRGQVYTMACSSTKDPQAGCLLCHADAQGRTALN